MKDIQLLTEIKDQLIKVNDNLEDIKRKIDELDGTIMGLNNGHKLEEIKSAIDCISFNTFN